MKQQKRRRMLAILSVGLASALTFGSTPPMRIHPTLAAWTDSERTAATTTAAALQAPTNLTCTLNPALLGRVGSVTLTWKTTLLSPASFRIGVAPGAHGQPSNMTEISGANPQLVNGTQDTYTVTISIDILTGLLAGVIGATSTIGVANAAGTNWVSATIARAELSIPPLGLVAGSTCRTL